jgi:hypothetical protein
MHIHEFSRVNRQRAKRWHPKGLDSWSLSDWATALAGEVGDAAAGLSDQADPAFTAFKANLVASTEVEHA